MKFHNDHRLEDQIWDEIKRAERRLVPAEQRADSLAESCRRFEDEHPESPENDRRLNRIMDAQTRASDIVQDLEDRLEALRALHSQLEDQRERRARRRREKRRAR